VGFALTLGGCLYNQTVTINIKEIQISGKDIKKNQDIFNIIKNSKTPLTIPLNECISIKNTFYGFRTMGTITYCIKPEYINSMSTKN
jgi:hypothetical protein